MLGCFGVFFELYLCFSALVCYRLYLVICVLFRVYVRYFFCFGSLGVPYFSLFRF